MSRMYRGRKEIQKGEEMNEELSKEQFEKKEENKTSGYRCLVINQIPYRIKQYYKKKLIIRNNKNTFVHKINDVIKLGEVELVVKKICGKNITLVGK